MRSLPWLVAAAVLASGVVWRDSVLIACSTLFALQAFELHMDTGSPWQAWRAALRCWDGLGVTAVRVGLVDDRGCCAAGLVDPGQ